MLDSVIAEANHDVDVTLRRRRNTNVPIDDPVISDVDKRVSVVQGSTEAVASTWSWIDRISIWLKQDKFECVTDYKWIILYFISLNFIVF